MDQLCRNGVRGDRESDWADVLVEMFQFCCCADLSDGSWRMIKETDEFSPPARDGQTFFDAMRLYGEERVFREDQSEFALKLSKDYILAQLCGDVRSYSFDYRVLGGAFGRRWVRGTVTLLGASPDGEPRRVVYTVQDIDGEKEEKVLLESSLGLMRDTFYRIGCIDLNRNSMRTICISESERGEIPEFSEDFNKAIRRFAECYVLPVYRENFLNVMLPERLKAIFDGGASYFDITYQRRESGVPTWVRTELAPPSRVRRGKPPRDVVREEYFRRKGGGGKVQPAAAENEHRCESSHENHSRRNHGRV